MFSADEQTARYRPRLQDAPVAIFHRRMEACAECPLRAIHTCLMTNQLVTVMARHRAAKCLNGSWEEKPRVWARPDEAPLDPPTELLIPLRCQPAPARFEGACRRKPWDYQVTACIPAHNSAKRLELIIELLRCQTVPPFIVLVDCGSSPKQFAAIEALRAEDVEVHALRLHGVEHSSEPISIAMDFALARAATRFAFFTHDDVFLRSRYVLQALRNMAHRRQAAGHRITRRPHDDWRGMFGHSSLMLDAEFFTDRGLTWHMRRGNRLFGIRRSRAIPGTTWPDTETGINYLAREAGVRPVLLGREKNHKRTVDRWIDHCRSAGGRAIYAPEGAAETKRWVAAALREGWDRVALWRSTPLPEAPPLQAPPLKPRLPLPTFTPHAY